MSIRRVGQRRKKQEGNGVPRAVLSGKVKSMLKPEGRHYEAPHTGYRSDFYAPWRVCQTLEPTSRLLDIQLDNNCASEGSMPKCPAGNGSAGKREKGENAGQEWHIKQRYKARMPNANELKFVGGAGAYEQFNC